MHPSDRLEQREVRTEHLVLACQPEQHRCARIALLVHRVSETGNESAGRLRVGDHRGCDLVPSLVIAGERIEAGDHVVEKVGRVLGDAEKARATAEQACCDRPLERVGCAQVRHACGDRRGGEPVIGERDQHSLEQDPLTLGRPTLRHHPVGQLTEGDLAQEVGGQVVSEEPDVVGVGRAEPRAIGRHAGWRAGWGSGHRRLLWRIGHGCDSQSRISSECSPSSGGADV